MRGYETHGSLALLHVLTPDVWDAGLHELKKLTVISLQAAGLSIKLKEHENLQQTVNLLCGVKPPESSLVYIQ